MPMCYDQAPILKEKGQKEKSSKWGKAIRTHHLESIIFNGISGKCGAQLKLILFLTGNSASGNFAIAEKTVMERCGMTKETYKKSRKALIEKGWIIHNKGKNGQPGEIIVDYDAIYASENF